MALSLSDICILFGRKGGRAYDGEPVTQLERAPKPRVLRPR